MLTRVISAAVRLVRVAADRRAWAALSLVAANTPAAACDMCGCFMGLTPYDNQSSVTLLTRYRVFSGYAGQAHPLFPDGAPVVGLRSAGPAAVATVPPLLQRPAHTGHDHAPAPDAADYEVFRVVELRGRYFLSQRLELDAFVPYVLNDTRTAGTRTTVRGLGDVTLFAGYHLLRRIEVAGPQQRLIVGAGGTLPTGSNSRTDVAGTRYESLVQPGAGAASAFVYANYLIGYKNAGLSLNGSLKVAGQNRYRESTAPSTAQFANLFYTVGLGEDWKLIPSAQFYYEYTQGETADGELTGEHRMNNVLLGPGLDVFWRNLALKSAVQLPVHSESAAGHTVSAGRVVLGLTYSFKQMNYLLGGR